MTLEQTQRAQQGIILPSNIKPNVFTTFCWDNNDLSEQTLSGSGTTHCTNGILLQREVHTCEPPPHLLQNMSSGNVPSEFMRLTPEQHKGPGILNMKLADDSIDEQVLTTVYMVCCKTVYRLMSVLSRLSLFCYINLLY